MVKWIQLLRLFALVKVAASASSNECEASDQNCAGEKFDEGGGTNTNANTCSVYLAPSSVPGGGLGIFTAKAVKHGDIILPADGPSIPIIDPDNSERSIVAWVQLFSGYWWDNGRSDPTVYEADFAIDYQITMGSLPNSHPCLDNFDAGNPATVPYDDSLLDRESDPGAGAYSYYMGRHSIAHKRDISAGEEMFLEYPTHYMDYICEKYNIPTRQDYDEAGVRLSDFLNLSEGDTIASDAATGTALEWSGSDKVVSLLPKSQSDLDRIILSSNGSYEPEDLTLAIANEMSVEKRSPQWLEKNGICLDNILPGKSSNPQAGRGAIAQRSIKKGETIAPASLLQITDRDALRIPAFEGKDMQLLLNYCFGRDDSSLLLCPNTNALLLNHCSSRRPKLHPCGNGTVPNADYRWASWDEATSKWLEKTIDDMEAVFGSRGLSLEIFATTDIREGDEVFIDYGENWELSWDRHLSEWEPFRSTPTGGGEWKSAKVLNEELGPLIVAPGIDVTSTDSRGVLFTGCLYEPDDDDEWEIDFDGDWESLPIDDLINEFGTPAKDFCFIDSNYHYSDGSFWPCVVLERYHEDDDEEVAVEDDYYTVRILQSHAFDDLTWEELQLPRIIKDFPRTSIRHFYLPYKSDLHLPNAFRHHMELKDDIFPKHWKNKQSAK